MALVKCPDCGNECSSDATSCPKCGKPIAQQSLATKDLGIGGCAYVLVAIVGLLLISSKSTAPIGILILALGVVLLIARLKMWKGTGRR